MRAGTSEEIRGIEAVHEVFNDLKARFDRAKANVIEDHTGDPLPEGALRPEPLGEEPGVEQEGVLRGAPRPRLEEPETPVPDIPLVPDAEPEPPQDPEPPVPLPSTEDVADARRQTSQNTESEGESAINQQGTNAASASTARTTTGPSSSTEGQAPPTVTQADRLRAAMESAYRNDLLDDALPQKRRPRPVTGPGPLRDKEDHTSNPYLVENDFFADEQLPEPEVFLQKSTAGTGMSRDHWEILPSEGVLRRHHRKWRTHLFSPWEAKLPPDVNLADLASTRSTHMVSKGGSCESQDDDWKAMKPSKRAPSKWRGHSDFYLTSRAAKQLRKSATESFRGFCLEPRVAEVYKIASDEVQGRDIGEDEREEWRQADAEEWAKIVASGAVKVLTSQESAKYLQKLKAEGKQDRVLGSRIVRRRKPGEQPGEAPTRKSRWVVKGFEDPDILELDRYCPTVVTQNLNVVLQVASSRQMPGSCGDLKQAFMQSDPLTRAQGAILVRQPPGGLPGLERDQLILVVHGVYGLADAPLHWRKTLKSYLTETLNYKQSRLDPTIFTLHLSGELEGSLWSRSTTCSALASKSISRGCSVYKRGFALASTSGSNRKSRAPPSTDDESSRPWTTPSPWT